MYLPAAFYFSRSAAAGSGFEQQEEKHHRQETCSDESNFEKENERRFLPDQLPKHFPEKKRVKVLSSYFKITAVVFQKVRPSIKIEIFCSPACPPPIFLGFALIFLFRAGPVRV